MKEYNWIFQLRDGKTKSRTNNSAIFAMIEDTLVDHMEKIFIELESIYVVLFACIAPIKMKISSFIFEYDR